MAITLRPELAVESFRHYTVVELRGQYTRGVEALEAGLRAAGLPE